MTELTESIKGTIQKQKHREKEKTNNKMRDGRWEGGSGWGTHVHPWLIHVKVWQKPPKYCKVISLQLK